MGLNDPSAQYREEDVDYDGPTEDKSYVEHSDKTSVYEAASSDSDLEAVDAAMGVTVPVSATDVPPPPPPKTYMELEGVDDVTYKSWTVNGTARSLGASRATNFSGIFEGRPPQLTLGKSLVKIKHLDRVGVCINRTHSDHAVSHRDTAYSTAWSLRNCTRADGARVPGRQTKKPPATWMKRGLKFDPWAPAENSRGSPMATVHRSRTNDA